MAIQVGDNIPQATLKVMGDNGPEDVSTTDLLGSGKVVLFAVPGAFTPTCTAAHLPGYVVHADDFKAKGVDKIVCMAVNDAFVMDAWGKANNAENLSMVADGNCEFTEALGLTMDGSGFGLGQRSQRFALVAENGKVTHLAVEEGGGLKVSSAEAVLAAL